MAQCPVCQAQIKDDFGLVTCTSCGTPVMLEFDGGAQAVNPSETSVQDQITNAAIESIASVESVETFEPLEDFNPINERQPEAQNIASETPAVENMNDVAAYGNEAQSQGQDGLLRYHLFISGVDTKEIRQIVEEAFHDERFLWNSREILSGLKDGELTVKDLTAVKAAILVQRLRAAPVRLRWEQHAIF